MFFYQGHFANFAIQVATVLVPLIAILLSVVGLVGVAFVELLSVVGLVEVVFVGNIAGSDGTCTVLGLQY